MALTHVFKIEYLSKLQVKKTVVWINRYRHNVNERALPLHFYPAYITEGTVELTA